MGSKANRWAFEERVTNQNNIEKEHNNKRPTFFSIKSEVIAANRPPFTESIAPGVPFRRALLSFCFILFTRNNYCITYPLPWGHSPHVVGRWPPQLTVVAVIRKGIYFLVCMCFRSWMWVNVSCARVCVCELKWDTNLLQGQFLNVPTWLQYFLVPQLFQFQTQISFLGAFLHNPSHFETLEEVVG